jgi:signal transduction histidine kinase
MSDATESPDLDLIRKLSGHRSLAEVPSVELEWLASHGTVVDYEEGEIAHRPGEPIAHLWICLEGRITHEVDRGAGPRRVMDWRAGDIAGVLPFSRMTAAPGTTIVLEPSEILQVHKEWFPELIRECPALTARMVHTMLDRARTFRTSDLHDEKMISLGRMAAGLAHELNNPASAALRSAKVLATEIGLAEAAALELGEAGLDGEQRMAVERARSLAMRRPETRSFSSIERANREEDILDWLEAHEIDSAHAAPLAETSISTVDLDQLSAAIPADVLARAVAWITRCTAALSLASDIERATGRIHALVSAVKRFSYLDRSPRMEPVDIAAGLTDTITVLGSKARSKSVTIEVDVEEGLPPVMGSGGELNQVWLNLMENALDAVSESGHIEVTARIELGCVLVRFIDDGHGIPSEVVEQIFDPFFTTKPPGEGTGLGLEIAHHLIGTHGGEIEVESRPGRTEFRVRLPPARAGAEA